MDGQSRSDGWLVLGVFLLAAGALAIRAMVQSATVPLIADTDDAMRLVVVRDLLAGQGWFDHMQYRLDTPYGAELHWSRLVDLPIAVIIWVLRPMLGTAAETAAAYIYPLAMLLGLLWLNLRLALSFAGRGGLLPGLVLPVLSVVTIKEFAPGRFDHHSAQILLLLAALLLAVGALDRPRRAIGSGVAVATAIAIGVESLPTVVAAVAAFGIIWVIDPRHALAMRLFGLALAASMAIHLAIALPPNRWFTPACDAISIVYVAGGIGAGLLLAALSLLPLKSASAWMRLGIGSVTGVVLVALVVLSFPDCLRGPYASVDPWLITNWIDKIAESESLLAALGDDTATTVGVAAPALLATIVAVWCVFRAPRERRTAWIVYLIFLGLALVVMLVQIRASRMATALAVPAGAYVIATARERYLSRQSLAATGALVAGWIGFAGAAWALAAGTLAAGTIPMVPSPAAPADGVPASPLAASLACRMPPAYEQLAGFTPTRIMAPVDLGSHVLAFTSHSVVAAPYHRDVDGLHDTFDFFNGPIEAGRDILDRRGIKLVVTCPGLPELDGVGDVAPDAFNRLYPKHALPAWLVDESEPGSTLRIYAVEPRS